MTAKPPRARLLAGAPDGGHAIAALAPEGTLDLRRVRRRRWARRAVVAAVTVPLAVASPWAAALLVLELVLIVRFADARRADRILSRIGKLIVLGRLDDAHRLLDRRTRTMPELYEDGGVAVAVLRMHVALRRGDHAAALACCDAALAAMGDAPRWTADRRLDTQLTRVELLLDLASIDDAEAQAATTFPAAQRLPELRDRVAALAERLAAARPRADPDTAGP